MVEGAASKDTNQEVRYDVVVSGGRVIDPETGFDAVANVGIIGGRIGAITDQPLAGARTLAADGLVVSPGFIDLHAHGQQLPAAWMQAFDGVTTALELESGLLPVAAAYDRMAAEGRPINYGLGSSASFARAMAMHPELPPADGSLAWFQNAFKFPAWQTDPASEEQVDKIIRSVEEGLDEGALGVSVNAGYNPGMGRKEYFRLAELASRHGVATFTHARYMSTTEPMSAFDAVEEMVGLAALTGAHMHICHINSVANRDLDDCVALVRRAQDLGLPVSVESYTYGTFSTVIGANFLRGPDWLERFGGADYGAVEERGRPLTKDEIEHLQATAPGTVVNFHFLRDETNKEDERLLDLAVMYPGGSIGSDGMPWIDSSGAVVEGDVWPLPEGAFAHPRSCGCFSRLFARWVRERGKMSLSEAIRKCSLIPAQILEPAVPEMGTKGRLQVGCDADITVFDPATIQDNGTFTAPAQTATGHRHVLVNGTPIIEDGQRNGGCLPGRPVRRSV